ncbi:hypothetical protein DXE02_10065 [Vibrio parahaemolyticus]|uniref:Polysaccharide polymerase n=6 Tax=Vibrionaceae TaxID=641 RepID=A0A7M1VW50_VIBPH|nr:O-antigen polymerase [Vibrio parahaemolyticus]EGR3326782.1 hypothetical protein [Vibrio parahaemolyticus]MDI7847778.1 oligosaccharide repeat unit polymerase [Vibrio parahaemolyticus]MQD28900.1 oligosaccharide repeat unit polymerase [Vibrio parahaemolyticus]MQE01221.1 oligosaccharide repeat unit polymerase [Vibrio parahaemolyticus]MQE20554.1 oligosaccharide repeat unit polymerase [Vibrio parahaemolyticus]
MFNLSVTFFKTLILSFSFFIIGIYAYLNGGFYQKLELDVFIYSAIDIFFTCIVVSLFVNKRYARELSELSSFFEINKNKLFLIFVLLAIIPVFYSIHSINHFLSGGIKEELKFPAFISIYMMFFSTLTKVLFPISVALKSSKRYVMAPLFFCLFLSLSFGGSTAELLFVMFSFVVLSLMYKLLPINKIILLIVSLFSFAVLISALVQSSRYGGNLFAIPFKLFMKLATYRSFSFYLADYVNQLESYYMILYPFLGYGAGKFNEIFSSSANLYNNEFVMVYRNIGFFNGNYYLANVIYPWWSFFFQSFGIIGLFIKPVYLFFIFKVVTLFRLRVTLFFLIVYNIFLAQQTHMLLTINSYVLFFSLIVFDLIVNNGLRKVN